MNAELSGSSRPLPEEGFVSKVERVMPLAVSCVGEGMVDAAREAWQHKSKTLEEVGISVAAGAFLAMVQSRAFFPKLLTEIGGIALGTAAFKNGIDQSLPGLAAIKSSWQSGLNDENDRRIIKASLGHCAFDSALAFSSGALGVIGARTIPVALEERAILRDMQSFHAETAEHSVRTGRYAELTARQMGLSYGQQRRVFHAGLMHDAGKLDMPLEVLGNSSGHVLSPEDLEIVHQHPFDTLHRLQEIPYKGALKPVPEDASMHHEWANGQGYPRHLTIDQIPQAARAIPPADVFDAVTAGRAYMHQRMPLGEVKTMMDSGKGTHFDSSALDSFWNIPADKAISVLESGPHRQPLSSSTLSMFKGHPLGRLLDVTNGATATTQEKNLAQMLTDIYARPAI